MIIRIFCSSEIVKGEFRARFPQLSTESPIGQTSFFNVIIKGRAGIIPVTEWACHHGYSFETVDD